jgi:predicted SnoaL-like aldol condensation-catalyzing enzyme
MCMPEGQNGIITKGTKMYRMQMNASTTVIQMEKITHLIMIEIENVRTKGSTNRSFLDISRHSSNTINSGDAVGR